MRTLVTDAQVEIQLPDILAPTGYEQEVYTKKQRVRMRLCLKVDNLVLREPSGRTVTIRQLVIDRIDGTILPVVDGDRVVMFDVVEADKPIVIEG